MHLNIAVVKISSTDVFERHAMFVRNALKEIAKVAS
jgi:hypothetical protein